MHVWFISSIASKHEIKITYWIDLLFWFKEMLFFVIFIPKIYVIKIRHISTGASWWIRSRINIKNLIPIILINFVNFVFWVILLTSCFDPWVSINLIALSTSIDTSCCSDCSLNREALKNIIHVEIATERRRVSCWTNLNIKTKVSNCLKTC